MKATVLVEHNTATMYQSRQPEGARLVSARACDVMAFPRKPAAFRAALASQ